MADAPDTVLYDGDCPLCSAAVRRIVSDAPAGAVRARSFRDAGVLAEYPGIVAARCEQAVHLVRADGRVLTGAGAIATASRHRWWGRALLAARRVAPLRRATDAVYAWVARNRHRLRKAPWTS